MAEFAGRVITVALVMIPDPDGTVAFLQRERGPHGRWWRNCSDVGTARSGPDASYFQHDARGGRGFALGPSHRYRHGKGPRSR